MCQLQAKREIRTVDVCSADVPTSRSSVAGSEIEHGSLAAPADAVASALAASGKPDTISANQAARNRFIEEVYEIGLAVGTEGAIVVISAAGWSSLVARRAHNPKVTGSNPVPATKESPGQDHNPARAFSFSGPLLPDLSTRFRELVNGVSRTCRSQLHFDRNHRRLVDDSWLVGDSSSTGRERVRSSVTRRSLQASPLRVDNPNDSQRWHVARLSKG